MEKQDNLEANVLLDNIADIHAKLITMNYILDDIVSSDIFTTNNYPELKNGNLAVNLNDLGFMLEGAKCNIREICFPIDVLRTLNPRSTLGHPKTSFFYQKEKAFQSCKLKAFS